MLGGAALLFAAGLVDDVYTLPAPMKLAAQFGAAAIVLSTGLSVEIVSNDVLAAAHRPALARRDDERLQPARQHGRARRDARRRSPPPSSRSTPSPSTRSACCSSSRSRSASPASAFCPSTSGPGSRRSSSWATRAARCSASRSPRSVSRRAGRWPRRRSRRCCCRSSSSRSRSSTPRSSTAVRLRERRPIHQGGSDHTSHRLVRGGLSEKNTVVLLAAIAAGLGATCLAYSVLGDSGSRSSACSSPLRCSCSSPASSPTSSAAHGPGRGVPGGWMLRTVVLHRGGCSRCCVDFVLISACFSLAYLLVVREPAPSTSGTSSWSRCR